MDPSIEEEVGEETMEEESCSYDSGNPEDLFAHLERNYNKIMLDMCDNPAMSKYADAYTAMFDFTYSMHVKAQNLTNCTEKLEMDVLETDKRLIEASQIMVDDAALISALKNEVQSSHQQLDNAHAREQAAMEVIDNLRHTINSLENEIEFKKKMNEVEDDENPTVTKHRQGLEREREKLLREVARMNEKFDAAVEYQEELEQRTDQTDAQIHKIIQELDAATLELNKHRRIKGRLEQEVRDLAENLDSLNEEIFSLNATVGEEQREVVKLDGQLKEQCGVSTKCVNEINVLNQKYCKLQDELNMLQYAENTEIMSKEKLNKRLDNYEREANMIKADIAMHIYEKDKTLKKREKLLEDSFIVNKERGKIRDELEKAEGNILRQKVVNDTAKRTIANKMREKDMISRNVVRQQAITLDTMQHIDLQQVERKKMELIIESHLEQQKAQRRHMGFLERERDRLKEVADEKSLQTEDIMDKLRQQKIKILDKKKRLNKSINELRMQNASYEACCIDKSNLEKSLRENLIYSNNLRVKLHEYTRNNEIMKNSIFDKELDTQHKAKENKMILAETIQMQEEHKNNQIEIQHLRASVAEHKAMLKDLMQKIEAADFQLRADDKKIVMYMNERNVLSAQLVLRNEELFYLYKKLDLLKKVMIYGKNQYGCRLEDLTLLKKEILRMRQEKCLFVKKISNMNDCKSEVLALEMDLTRERIKCKMLQEEMRSPLNMHRWSKLEESDPEMFLLMRKILAMQKKGLKEADVIYARALQLREMNTLYRNFRKMASKQAGPNILKRIKATKSSYDESLDHMKVLKRERKGASDEVNKIQLTLRNVNLQLRKERQKLLNEKKARRLNLEVLRKVEQKGQEIMDEMALMLNDKTVMKLALKSPDDSV